jgi:hypothetical protein
MSNSYANDPVREVADLANPPVTASNHRPDIGHGPAYEPQASEMKS